MDKFFLLRPLGPKGNFIFIKGKKLILRSMLIEKSVARQLTTILNSQNMVSLIEHKSGIKYLQWNFPGNHKIQVLSSNADLTMNKKLNKAWKTDGIADSYNPYNKQKSFKYRTGLLIFYIISIVFLTTVVTTDYGKYGIRQGKKVFSKLLQFEFTDAISETQNTIAGIFIHYPLESVSERFNDIEGHGYSSVKHWGKILNNNVFSKIDETIWCTKNDCDRSFTLIPGRHVGIGQCH